MTGPLACASGRWGSYASGKDGTRAAGPVRAVCRRVDGLLDRARYTIARCGQGYQVRKSARGLPPADAGGAPHRVLRCGARWDAGFACGKVSSRTAVFARTRRAALWPVLGQAARTQRTPTRRRSPP